MIKKTVVLLAALVYSAGLLSQHAFGIKAGGGLSRISNGGVNVTEADVKFAPSFQGGFFYNYKAAKKIVLGAELLFSQINGKQTISIPSVITDNQGNITGYSDQPAYLSKSFSYLALPLYAGITLKKLSFNLGMQVSYALAASSRYQITFSTNNGNVKIDDKEQFTYYHHVDAGPRAALLYHFSKRLAAEANYYYGLVNIFKIGVEPASVSQPRPVLHSQQLTLSLRYAIFSSE